MTVQQTNMATSSARATDGWPRKTWTHHDLDRMAEAGLLAPDEHVELIEGEIYPMPSKGNRHERVRLALNVWLYDQLGKDKMVLPEAGWRPALRDYLEPDFLIVPRHVVPPEFPGSDVLLAIEIADSSFGYDTTIKRNCYAGLGVMEYWVIHAWELTTRVHRAPIAGDYSDYVEQPPTARLTPTLAPELALALTDLGIA